MRVSDNLRYDLEGLLKFGRGSLVATCNYLTAAFNQCAIEVSARRPKATLRWNSERELILYGTESELIALYEMAVKLAEQDEAKGA